MEPATFVASALAGAFLKEVAVDAYKAAKARLLDVFHLGTSVAALESAPEADSARNFLAATLSESGAVNDGTVISLAQEIAAELEKLPDDTRLGASLTVKDIKAEAATFRRIKIHGGGQAVFSGIEAKRRLVAEDIEVGDDRKR